MGQQVVTLMWGISKTMAKGLTNAEGEYPWEDYSDGVPPEKRLRYDDKRRPRSAYEGDVLGFAVASGPAHNDDEGFLGSTSSLKDLERTNAKHIKAAKKRWDAFTKWLLTEHNRTLPRPSLWLTTDERA